MSQSTHPTRNDRRLLTIDIRNYCDRQGISATRQQIGLAASTALAGLRDSRDSVSTGDGPKRLVYRQGEQVLSTKPANFRLNIRSTLEQLPGVALAGASVVTVWLIPFAVASVALSLKDSMTVVLPDEAPEILVSLIQSDGTRSRRASSSLARIRRKANWLRGTRDKSPLAAHDVVTILARLQMLKVVSRTKEGQWELAESLVGGFDHFGK